MNIIKKTFLKVKMKYSVVNFQHEVTHFNKLKDINENDNADTVICIRKSFLSTGNVREARGGTNT